MLLPRLRGRVAARFRPLLYVARFFFPKFVARASLVVDREV